MVGCGGCVELLEVRLSLLYCTSRVGVINVWIKNGNYEDKKSRNIILAENTELNPSLTDNHYLVEEIMVLIIMAIDEIYLTG